MTETKVLEVLGDLMPEGTSQFTINRAIQTAKQIGSSWPTPNINVQLIVDDKDNEFWKVVIE